jgi:transcriptional regulator with XRE-family HTH domain
VPLPPSTSSAWQARQALGARLGEIRKDAGLTGRALAELCGWHEAKVSRIEHARTAPSAADIRLWCQHCGTPGETDNLLASLRSVADMFVEWLFVMLLGTFRDELRDALGMEELPPAQRGDTRCALDELRPVELSTMYGAVMILRQQRFTRIMDDPELPQMLGDLEDDLRASTRKLRALRADTPAEAKAS